MGRGVEATSAATIVAVSAGVSAGASVGSGSSAVSVPDESDDSSGSGSGTSICFSRRRATGVLLSSDSEAPAAPRVPSPSEINELSFSEPRLKNARLISDMLRSFYPTGGAQAMPGFSQQSRCSVADLSPIAGSQCLTLVGEVFWAPLAAYKDATDLSVLNRNRLARVSDIKSR